MFFFSFISFHIIFGTKYWILSLKINALMTSEEIMRVQQTRMVNGVFWSMEVLLAISSSFFIVNGYRGQSFGPTNYSAVLENIGYAGVFISATVSVVIVADAFRRLNKCLEHDTLSISRKTIIIHLTLFVISTVSLIFLCSVFILGSRTVDNGVTNEK